jgi:hypothetical protein
MRFIPARRQLLLLLLIIAVLLHALFLPLAAAHLLHALQYFRKLLLKQRGCFGHLHPHTDPKKAG